MSWDVMLFHLNRKVDSIAEIGETMFVLTNFYIIFAKHFAGKIIEDDDHREITGDNFSIDYFTDTEPTGNKLLKLYGEQALFEIVDLCKTYN